MIVVDTNVICYLFLSSPLSISAERALKRDSDWGVPLLWRSEFRNVLAGYLRRGDLTRAQVREICDQAVSLVERSEFAVSSEAVFNVVAVSSCSAYDCEFVALAMDLQVPLITADRRILADFPDTAVSLEEFAASTGE